MKYSKVNIILNSQLKLYKNRKNKILPILIFSFAIIMIMIIIFLFLSDESKVCEWWTNILGTLGVINIFSIIVNVLMHIVPEQVEKSILIQNQKILFFDSDNMLLVYENENSDIYSISCRFLHKAYNTKISNEECILDFESCCIKLGVADIKSIDSKDVWIKDVHYDL